ncbi:MAG: FtsQ-type POTRA domain-containing protein [Desulfobacterales bacterium]|jgi:cell division protein FtsQ|nr:FtsQ-type POTRA domain-containing protein [Desulfobacterales bacterium]
MNRRITPQRAGAPRRNISRKARAARLRRLLERALLGLKLAAGAAGVVLVSLMFVFIHDLFIQNDYFNARQIEVEGHQRVSLADIRTLTGIRPGVNVLSVNLSAARRQLLAHPWVAEAQVHRQLPSGLLIRLREHQAVAIVDLGQRFLLNAEGEVFKPWEASDPAGLTVVSGLHAADVRAADRAEAAAPHLRWIGRAQPPAEPLHSRPMEAVLQVLALGREPHTALPIREMHAIRVDRELGVTVMAFDENAAVRLGYGDFESKYRLLAELLAFFKAHPPAVNFDRIDLTDVHRVIVSPVKTDPAHVRGG